MGAIGIGRCFMYSGAHGNPMQVPCDLIDARLLKVKDWMKTETGRRMAEERAERLRTFKEWWKDEEGEHDA